MIKDKRKRNQRTRLIVKWITQLFWINHWMSRARALKDAQKNDESTLDTYELITRQLPPRKIKLLKNDVLVYYFFDFTVYSPLKNGVTLELDLSFSQNSSFYQLQQNHKQPNLTYLIINAKNIQVGKPINFEYNISAIFYKGNNKKKSIKSYQILIEVVEKYKASRANFRGFEEGFTFRMRSNDTDVAFPMNLNDIFENNMNLTIKQIGSSQPDRGKVEVKVRPMVLSFNASYYIRTQNFEVNTALGVNLHSDIFTVQRKDIPKKYQLQFFNFTDHGVINII